MDNKIYSTQRKKLILPEYGRHIQQMVDYLSTIEDKSLRTRMAHSIIAVMGNINTVLRDTSDFRHKLWDHLFIMAEFNLEVDSPYPIPDKSIFEYKPTKMRYPGGIRRHKQYGNNVKKVINSIKDKEESPERLATAISAAKFMKVKSFEYNQEYPSDEIIIDDIRKFSDGKIDLDDDTLNSTKLNYRNQNKSKSMLSKRRQQPSQQKSMQSRRRSNQSMQNGKPNFKGRGK